MSYTALAVTGVVVVVLADLFAWRTRLVTRRAFWTAYAIVLVFQLAVNGVLTGVPVVLYAPDAITGLRVLYEPVEDLLFGFAMVLLTLSAWVWLGRHGPVRDRPPAAGGGAAPPPGR